MQGQGGRKKEPAKETEAGAKKIKGVRGLPVLLSPCFLHQQELDRATALSTVIWVSEPLCLEKAQGRGSIGLPVEREDFTVGKKVEYSRQREQCAEAQRQ